MLFYSADITISSKKVIRMNKRGTWMLVGIVAIVAVVGMVTMLSGRESFGDSFVLSEDVDTAEAESSLAENDALTGYVPLSGRRCAWLTVRETDIGNTGDEICSTRVPNLRCDLMQIGNLTQHYPAGDSSCRSRARSDTQTITMGCNNRINTIYSYARRSPCQAEYTWAPEEGWNHIAGYYRSTQGYRWVKCCR